MNKIIVVALLCLLHCTAVHAQKISAAFHGGISTFTFGNFYQKTFTSYQNIDVAIPLLKVVKKADSNKIMTVSLSPGLGQHQSTYNDYGANGTKQFNAIKYYDAHLYVTVAFALSSKSKIEGSFGGAYFKNFSRFSQEFDALGNRTTDANKSTYNDNLAYTSKIGFTTKITKHLGLIISYTSLETAKYRSNLPPNKAAFRTNLIGAGCSYSF